MHVDRKMVKIKPTHTAIFAAVFHHCKYCTRYAYRVVASRLLHRRDDDMTGFLVSDSEASDGFKARPNQGKKAMPFVLYKNDEVEKQNCN